jgi:hypothetical protein
MNEVFGAEEIAQITEVTGNTEKIKALLPKYFSDDRLLQVIFAVVQTAYRDLSGECATHAGALERFLYGKPRTANRIAHPLACAIIASHDPQDACRAWLERLRDRVECQDCRYFVSAPMPTNPNFAGGPFGYCHFNPPIAGLEPWGEASEHPRYRPSQFVPCEATAWCSQGKHA